MDYPKKSLTQPFKIMLQLEKDTEFGDSLLRIKITGYSFEMEGLRQGENKNYELVTDDTVTGQIIVHPTNIVLSYIGTLNKKGSREMRCLLTYKMH